MRLLLLFLIAGCGPKPVDDTIGDPSVLPDIERWNEWLEPGDLQRKYCKMSQSPYAFFRGTAHLYWKDLGKDKRLLQFGSDQTVIWLQGDSHVQNFGSFDDDQLEVVYDLNDFDEAVLADYQLDIWRLATSILLKADDDGGYSVSQIDQAVDSMTEAYLDELPKLVDNDDEEDAQFTDDNTGPVVARFLEDVEDHNDRLEMLEKWTDYDIGSRLFDYAHEDLEIATTEERVSILDDMDTYLASLTGGLPPDPVYFATLDIARRRNQGLGSLGVPRYYVLIEGESPDIWDDRILDVKLQSAPSASEAYPALKNADPFVHHAHRVARGQKALALHVDDHLGFLLSGNETYSVRERSPWKAALPDDAINGSKQLNGVAEDWGRILANAHARADDDFDSDLVPHSFEAQVSNATDGEHDEYRELVRSVARPYARHMEQGWLAFEHFVEEEFDFECEDDVDDG